MDRKLFLFILCCLFFSMQVDSSPCRDAVNGKRRVFLPFEEAMEKVPDEITSAVKYKVWRKDHPDMPSNPQNFYRDQWQSWGHFLRTGRVVVWGRDFLSFEQAMEKVQKDGVSSEGEYRAWRKDHPDMPSHPEQVYRDQWQSWGHFLGTGRVGVKKLFLPYNKAMEKVRRAGVSSKEKYKAWRKDHPDMPSNPQAVYGNQWQSWGFFLEQGESGVEIFYPLNRLWRRCAGPEFRPGWNTCSGARIIQICLRIPSRFIGISGRTGGIF